MNVRSITTYTLALAFLALSGRVALAQDRGQRGQNRQGDTTRVRQGTARTDTAPAPARENANGANNQGGHQVSDADRAVIAADEARKAAQAEQDRRAMQGRSNNNGQNPNNNGQNPSYNGQGRGQDRSNGQDRGQYNGQDRSNGQDRGQYNGQDRGYNGQDRRFGQNDPSFTDRDRQATRDWYQQHRNRLGPGWRDRDRLSPSLEGRLRRGQRLDPVLRQRMYWLPPDLAQMYGAPPRGYRYAIIGGNVVLLDDYYQVHDVFRIDLHF